MWPYGRLSEVRAFVAQPSLSHSLLHPSRPWQGVVDRSSVHGTCSIMSPKISKANLGILEKSNVAALASYLYLVVHALRQEDHHDTDDASAGEVYSILVSKSTVSAVQRPGAGNLAPRSWTGTHKHLERLRCTACDREFSAREGTLRRAVSSRKTRSYDWRNVSAGASVMWAPPPSVRSISRRCIAFSTSRRSALRPTIARWSVR